MARQQGFSLLEVLVAFLILSLSLGVLMRLFSQASSTFHSAHSRQLAMNLAQSKLAEIAGGDDLGPGRESGTFMDGYQWQSEIARYGLPVEFSAPNMDIIPFTVSVTVRWGEADNQQLTLTTLQLGRRQ